MKKALFIIGAMLLMTSCIEHYSDGEIVGTVTKFSKKGLIVPTYEGVLNVTQTGYNTSGKPLLFSVDRNRNDIKLIDSIKTCLSTGKIVKLSYHECGGLSNFFQLRGDTKRFVDKVTILR